MTALWIDGWIVINMMIAMISSMMKIMQYKMQTYIFSLNTKIDHHHHQQQHNM